MPAVNGIDVLPMKPKILCEPCQKGKLRKQNIPKITRQRNLMDTISGDEQDPFRIPGFDGTTYNVKFVEKRSRWMKMFTMPDIKANSILNVFIPWLERMENRTNTKLKHFHSDQSFDGEFLDYLESKGIVKQKGEAYDYYTPGQVENANKNIVSHTL
jgi:hypothetical protein